MKTAIIIGGGLGGLFTGAILAKEGLQVTVLEKNATAGGGLQSFQRFGVKFDTGMHVIGGMYPGGNIYRLCRYLGILDQMQLRDVDDDCTDSLYFAEDKTTYRIRKGREGFVDSLATYFPAERASLQAYVKAIFDITDEADLFNLRPSTDTFRVHSDDFFMSADAFIAKYIQDEKLRSVVAYMNPLYGGRQDETPAFIHAIISTLYIQGASRFVGGSYHFADLLTQLIEQQGGEVITGDAVEWIEVTTGDAVEKIEVDNRDRGEADAHRVQKGKKHVEYVRTRKGRIYRGDYYISDLHPCTLLRLMPEKSFTKAYRQRLEEIPNSTSAFSLYIKLKPNSFPYINHSEYYMTRYDEIWTFGEQHDHWPLGFLFMTPPEPRQGAYSQKALVTVPMLFDEVRRWENTTVGHRGEDYEAWKEAKTQVVLDKIEEMHPGFRACIDEVNASSPLTIRDFYGVKEGAASGYRKDYKNMALSQVPVVTKIDNLLLTGQNNNLHGFCGVPLTAISTAEAILGRNHVINQL